jgi:hypothetical protein
MNTPGHLAQMQLDAYNRQDLDGFISVYSKDVVVMDFPSNRITLSGIDEFMKRYSTLFTENPNQHAELKSRVEKGNIVIDHEFVTGRASGIDLEAIAIYEVNESQISKVWFVK